MISKLIRIVLENRLWTLGIAGIVFIAGFLALLSIPIDAVPDITPVQVIVNTRTGGLDPDRIEKTITFPIETELTGVPGVEQIRSLSRYGLSQVVVTLNEGTDIWKARQQIGERLAGVRENLPGEVNPELAPVTTGLGEVLMYTVKAKQDSVLNLKSAREKLMELRTVQDFVVRPALKRVPGVADVDSIGGFKQEIHFDLQPMKMEAHGVTIGQIIRSLHGLGETAGGGYIQKDGKQIILKGGMTVGSLAELANLPVRLDVFGNPIRVGQVTRVVEGHALRLGAATQNGEETVLGTVLMLSGSNSRQVAHDSAQAIRNLPLPEGIEIEPVYSRAFLVDATIRTVAENLGVGAALVVVVLLLFLGNVRASLLVALAIPFSMLMAAGGMKYFGLSANLMSLGAVDFGLLVDASIVIIDNVMRRLDERPSGIMSRDEKYRCVFEAVTEVGRPVAFGLGIIMLVYVPILSFAGIEGKIFRPMAMTVIMALGASLIVALCIMPVLVFFTISKRKQSGDSFLLGFLRRIYTRLLGHVLAWRIPVVCTAVAIFTASLFVFYRMGSDFVPLLDEGDLVINIFRESTIGIDRSVEMQKKTDQIIRRFGEVEEVFSRFGTSESGLDPMGINLSDTFVMLKKDRNDWPRVNGRRRTKDELYEAIREAVEREAPGQELAPTQPIQMRFNEILEGSRADITLRILGPDLETLMELVEKAESIVKPIPGTAEAEMDALTALQKSSVLEMRADPRRMAIYGVQLSDLNETFATAMSGHRVGSYYMGDRRIPVIAHIDEAIRNNISEIRNLPVELPEGGTLPLHNLSKIEIREQITTISRMYGQRYAALAIFLSGRDVDSYVQEAKQKIASGLDIPTGYRIEWGGQFENLRKARIRLMIVVPVTLMLIFLFLLRDLGSVRHALLVYTAVPFAITGGIFSLAARGIPFSISAAVGFIAVSGIAILNGIVLMHFMKELRKEGKNALETAVETAQSRLRPVLMTALVASLGFVPMALNTGIGAEVQRPLATVVIGGLITSTFLTMLLLPVLYVWLEKDKV